MEGFKMKSAFSLQLRVWKETVEKLKDTTRKEFHPTLLFESCDTFLRFPSFSLWNRLFFRWNRWMSTSPQSRAYLSLTGNSKYVHREVYRQLHHLPYAEPNRRTLHLPVFWNGTPSMQNHFHSYRRGSCFTLLNEVAPGSFVPFQRALLTM